MSVPVYIERAGDCDEIAAYNETTPVTGLSKWVQPNPRNVAPGCLELGECGKRCKTPHRRAGFPSMQNERVRAAG